MSIEGRLELAFVDVHGAPLADRVDIHLRHRVLSEQRRIEGHDARQPIAIPGLRPEPNGLYVLEVRPRAYWPVTRFVTIAASGLTRETITLPIRPDSAQAVFPSYDDLDDRMHGILERSSQVRGHEGLAGRRLFDALSPENKAGLLNISKKSLTFPFRDGLDLLPHLTVIEVRGDRCFVEVPLALKNQMADHVENELFRAVSGSLHEPPTGFESAGSYKTLDAFGNLQLTFFQSGDRVVADVDIDDAGGLHHVFQVMRNHLTGKPTHPFNIHQILLMHQHLDPGYRLEPKAG